MTRRIAGLGLSVAVLGVLAGAAAWAVTAVLLPGRTNLPVPVVLACMVPWGVALAGLLVAGVAGLAGHAARSAGRDRG